MRQDSFTGSIIHSSRIGGDGTGSFVAVGQQEARHTSGHR